MDFLLELQDIEAGYGDIKVLYDFNLRIASGDNILILGPNGAGKTTIFKVITGLIKPYKGKVVFEEKDITDWETPKRINAGIGYLLQTENIFPSLTAEDNLRLSIATLKQEIFETRLKELISVVPALESILSKRAGLLSGGERQLLAIAMVLIKKPKILLLDEPTAGLAPKAAKEIIDYLIQFQKNIGISTVCMIEHNLREALKWANRVLIIAHGKLIYETQDIKSCLSNPQVLEKYFF